MTKNGTAKLSSLLGALCGMDGIVVFATDFTIRAYGALVDVNEGDARGSDGGARSLALSALKRSHSDKLVGVLFRSQDGAPRYEQMTAPWAGVVLPPRK